MAHLKAIRIRLQPSRKLLEATMVVETSKNNSSRSTMHPRQDNEMSTISVRVIDRLPNCTHHQEDIVASTFSVVVKRLTHSGNQAKEVAVWESAPQSNQLALHTKSVKHIT